MPTDPYGTRLPNNYNYSNICQACGFNRGSHSTQAHHCPRGQDATGGWVWYSRNTFRPLVEDEYHETLLYGIPLTARCRGCGNTLGEHISWNCPVPNSSGRFNDEGRWIVPLPLDRIVQEDPVRTTTDGIPQRTSPPEPLPAITDFPEPTYIVPFPAERRPGAMIYVYSNKFSESASILAKALGGIRVRNFDGMHFWQKGQKITVQPGDTIVCWGSPLPRLDSANVLNASESSRYEIKPEDVKKRKYLLMHTLMEHHTPCLHVALPGAFYSQPVAPWFPRTFGSGAYEDFIVSPPPVKVCDYYMYKAPITEEFRLHIFDNKVIRTGKRVPESDAHPWIRTRSKGWRMDYSDVKSTDPMRRLARKALSTTGMRFGAVDLGVVDSGLIVVDVILAPPIDGESAQLYAKAIQKWVERKGVSNEAPRA